jgi:hypothetical protein
VRDEEGERVESGGERMKDTCTTPPTGVPTSRYDRLA